jgi:hypothetical protein
MASCQSSFTGEMMGWIIALACIAAWFTHVFTCFAEGLWGFLIAGALLFPIGILHGMYLWFR